MTKMKLWNLGNTLTDSPPSQVDKTGVLPREYQLADSLAITDGFVVNNTTKQIEINSCPKPG